MSEAIEDFLAAMTEVGCAPDDGQIIADNALHRFQIKGDSIKTKNGAYMLRVDPDGFAVGWFKNWRDGETHTWHTKTSRKATPEDREQAKKRVAQMKAERDERDGLAKRLAADKATDIWGKSVKPTGREEYLSRKMIAAEGCRVYNDALVVPLRKGDAITGLQFIAHDGDKRFLFGSDVDGSYCSLAKRGDDLSTIGIGEGFATCASVRMATGWPVIVAFNAGNLKAVAKVMRVKYPDARIVILADNDQWSMVKGKPHNTGRICADQAAVAIGGAQVVWPDVDADDEARRTDWNDIHVSNGLDAVREGVMAAPIMAAVEPEIKEHAVSPQVIESVFDTIRPMGHDDGNYFFLPRVSGQIVKVSANSLGRMQTLYRLASSNFWQTYYGADGKASVSDMTNAASAHLIDECHQIGVFNPDKVRGVGAWIDSGKVIVNCGHVIVGNGIKSHPSEFKGKYLYEAGARVIDLDCDPLHNKEAAQLREVCRMLKWKRPQYADLLAGWLVLASIGSALKWRPHIVITGPKGCGKSTVMDDVVKVALGDIAINGDGGTTEAGARRVLGLSGRPFIMDEAESENKTTQSDMAKVFFLARRASSGAKVINAYGEFVARSCFCFAAINPRIEQGADKDRITTLELVVDKSNQREDNYAALLRAINDCMIDGFAQRLMARTIQNIDALFHNIKVFGSVAADILGDKRSGDQVGPMIAGAYSLVSTGKVTIEFAREWMEKQEWDWHSADNDLSDAEKLVTHIMTLRVRYDHDGRSYESSIGDMVNHASIKGAPGYDAADKGLRGYGIRVIDGRVVIANNSPQLKRMLDDTPWAVWRGTLGNYPDADNYGNKPVYFGSGFECKSISLPLDKVMGRAVNVTSVVEDEDIGFGDDWR